MIFRWVDKEVFALPPHSDLVGCDPFFHLFCGVEHRSFQFCVIGAFVPGTPGGQG